MENNDSLVLNELAESGSALRPSVQVEHALAEIKDTYQTSPLAKIPFTEIAALGGSFAGVVETMATPAAEGIYRCVFPKGVTGTLAMAKDGSGALGTIMNDGIVGQARWIPVDKAIGPACLKATLVAVAVLAVVKQVQDIKDGQKEIISILERDKKSQLLADYDLLASYMDDYKFYWENEPSLVVNLNQVKNIKRNAMKDLRSYIEQIEGMLSAKKNLLKMQTASYKIGQLLNRFVHYKLADMSRSVGSFIGKIPLVKEGPVDEFLIGVGDSISDAEKKQLEKTLAFFIQYKDSGLTPIAEHIATINHLSNKPVVMLYDKKVLCFHELREAV